jgi:LuxR family transcriptional regulator, quorum-sensing system regulator BjaR1
MNNKALEGCRTSELAMTHVHSLATALLTELRTAKQEIQINNLMSQFALRGGYKCFQLVPGPHNPSPDPAALLAFGSFPSPLAQCYRAERFCKDDPARAQAIMRASPVRWRTAFSPPKDEAAKVFLAQLRDHNLRDGVTIPVHGPQGCIALLMLAGPKVVDLQSEDEEALVQIAMALHQRVKRIAAAALFGEPTPVHLTEREKECLNWVLQGKTNWEIGVLTGVTARTVQFHLGNAARKLGVVNRVQAGVQALIRGDLNPPALVNELDRGSLSKPPQSSDDSPHGKTLQASFGVSAKPAAFLDKQHHADRTYASRR